MGLFIRRDNMDERLHSQLLRNIEKLRKVTETLSLESIVNLIGMTQFKFNRNMHCDLKSPFQQGMYLLGVVGSQPEPCSPKTLDDQTYKNICKLLNEIFQSYLT